MNTEEIIRQFLRDFPDLTLTREQMDRLAELIEDEFDSVGDDCDFD